MTIRSKIIETYLDVLEQTNCKLLVPELTDEVQLLQSGLDSLGFAILVATLDDELGFDPFSMMNEPLYPSSFGEFVSVYERMNPKK